MPATSSTTHLPALDAARGLAAMTVFLYHMELYFGDLPWLRGSFLSVDLFFLMSGFVIARSYDARLQSGVLSLFDFVRARVLRLYPLYLLACAIGLSYFAAKLLTRAEDAPTLMQMIAALPGTILLLPSPFTSTWGFTPFPFAPSAWSLSLELWCNILYAAVVIRLGMRALVTLALLSLAVLVHQAQAFGTLDLGWNLATTPGGIARFWFSFAMGVIILRLHRADQTWPAWTALALAPVLAYTVIPSDSIALGLIWVVAVFPAALLVAAGIRAQWSAAWISDHLGRLSYGIYILHAPVVLFGTGVAKVMLGPTWQDHRVLVGCALVVAVLALSALATYLFDEPLRRSLQSRRRASRVNTASRAH